MNEFEHFFLVIANVSSEGAVSITAKAGDDSVNHGGAEYVVLFEYATRCFKAVSRCFATVGELGKILKLVFVFLAVDVDIHIRAFRKFKRIVKFETVATGYGKSCDEIGRASCRERVLFLV